LRTATHVWWNKIFSRTNQISSQFRIPLATARPPAEGKKTSANDILERLDLSPLTMDMFLYDAKDLQELIARLRNPDYSHAGTGTDATRHVAAHLMVPWGVVQVQFKTATLSELRVKLAHLGMEYSQVGLDDVAVDISTDNAQPTDAVPSHLVADERYRVGVAILKSKSTAAGVFDSTEYVRRGCPMSIRPAMWRRVLCPSLTEEDLMGYSQLVDNVRCSSLSSSQPSLALCRVLSRQRTLLVFRQKSAIDDAIGLHACSLEARACM
jgi:hypothetical protein